MPSTASQMAEFYAQDKNLSRSDGNRGDGAWLLTAQQAYRTSTDFFDGNLRKVIEENMDLYRSKHPAGSKYNLPSFAKRSRLFRPKIRSAMRKKEAQVGKAFFATNDIVTVLPLNEGDDAHIAATKVQQAVLDYRLKQPKAMNWFMTVIGAYQDAERQGFVVSKTEWDHRIARQYYAEGDSTTRIVADRPKVTIIPCENLRIAPNCDWTDPIESSDYLIELMPMTIGRVREMIAQDSVYKWREVSNQQLMSGSRQEWDSIRQTREGNRQDRYDQRPGINEYETIWIHKNIVRIEGEDYVYLTIGTEIMLTEPMPLSELDPRGYRGYEWGYTVVEAHNPYPDGEVQMAKPVQEEINEMANMRADGTKMATIGRYFTRRGAGVDTEALVRFVPGSVVESNNPATDIKWDRAPEVGQGSFEEHNLLSQEMSDLLGTFQSGEVQGNRQMNETVGGMELIANNANEVAEFSVRTFTETWVEPVLSHVLDLICLWETDRSIATIVGDKLKMDADAVFRSLKTPMSVIVNVGYGSTNSESRIRRIQIGVGVTQQVDPMLMQGSNKSAILNEVWGALGYPDASRFFPTLKEGEGGELKRVTDENAQLRQMLEQGGNDQSKIQIAQINQETQIRLAEMKQAGAERLAQINNETKFLVERGKGELKMIELRIMFAKSEREKQELYMQREALSHTIQMAEREFALQVQGMQMEQQNVEADREVGKEERAAKGNEAKQKAAVPDATPPGVQQLINNLRSPASGAVAPSEIPGGGESVDMATGAPDMAGDEAGVISRGDYGAIPGAEG